MRKYALIAVAALAAALCVVPVANAINGTQGIKAKLAKKKAGTKKKPRNVGTLTVTTTTTPAPGEVGNFATKTAVIFFDKNLTFGGKKFPTCTLAQVNADERKCPAHSQVGTGTSKATVFGGEHLINIAAFNGSHGKRIFLLLKNSELNIHSSLIGTLSKASGPFGNKLTVVIPSNLQAPVAAVPGGFATLTSFITKVGGVSKGTPYVGLTGCKGGKLHFAGTFNYTDGTSKTASTTARCKK